MDCNVFFRNSSKITLIMSVPFIKPINHLLNSQAKIKKRKKEKDNKLQSSD